MSENDRSDGIVVLGGDGSDRRDDDRNKEETRNGFGSKLEKEKRVPRFRFRRKKKGSSNPSPSTVCNLGNIFCCFKQTPTLDSPADASPTSDPNSPAFSHELLRDLIEKNDFYSKECNHHRAIDCVNGEAAATEEKLMEIKLSFSPDSPPLAVIAAAEIAGIPLSPDSSLPAGSPPSFLFSNGLELRGTKVLLSYLGRTASVRNFYGCDALESCQMDEWLEYTSILASGAEFEGGCSYIDGYLLKRTFLVGHCLSIADIAIWAGLAGNGQRWESLRKSKKFANLVRWFNSLSVEYGAVLNKITSTYVGKRAVGKQIVASVKGKGQANGDVGDKVKAGIDLPDAEMGKVRLRFAPEPSGYLHIGHSKAALLNQYFAERYKGQVIVRFDDTNPAKESNEFVDNILKDIATLGIKYETVTYTSNYFPKLMEMAEKLIIQGKAYVDDTPREQMQKERMDGIESRCRNNNPEENMKLWKEMIAGSERGLQCCLRGKLDMQDPNKSLRDPVYYRSNPIPHHRIGSSYKIYPTYDFACPFVDSIEGITHALRSSEYHDRNAQYYRIQEDMGLRKVLIYEFSRLNLVYTLLSKRKLLWFVQNGKVEGWDDPRFPTVQGIVRRGLKIEALIEFIVEQGASKNLNLMEWDKLWTINKKIVDPVCPRHTAVIEDGRVMLTLTDGPHKPFVRIIPKHKKSEDAGEKATTYTRQIWIDRIDAESISVDEEITLMDWGNAIVREITKDESGKVVKLTGVLHLEGSVKTTKLKLTWLPETDELVNLSLVEFDCLITKKKLEEGEDFLDVLNENTKKETAALGDSNMRNLQRGDILQLERKGYFRCDVPFVRPSKPIVLFAIPDGRQQTGLKNGWSDEKIVTLLDFGLRTLAWLAISVYLRTHFKNSGGPRFPILLRVWWGFYFSMSCCFLVVDFLYNKNHQSLPTQLFVSDIISTVMGFFFCLLGFLGKKESEDTLLQEPLLHGRESKKSSGGEIVAPFSNASLLSILSFSWMGPLIAAGYKKTLDLNDVPQLAGMDSVKLAFPIFTSKLDSGIGTRITTFKLVKALIFVTKWEILLTAFLALIYTLASYVGPYLIDSLVQYLNGNRAFENQGYVLVSTFFVAKLIECLAQKHRFFRLQQAGIRARAVLVAIIYNKGLTISCQSKLGQTSGEIINLMSVDAQRISDFGWYLHDPWMVIVQVGLALIILYKNLGLASIAAFVTTVLVMLANVPLGRWQQKFQEKIMESKDKRMKATSEILRNMRILKLQAWEMKFLSKVTELRNTEMGWLKRFGYTFSLTTFLFWGAPTFVAVVTFGTCMLLGIPLESGKILSALATFTILQQPIYNLPDTISMIAQTKVSLDRIASFLRLDDLQSDVIEKLPIGSSDTAIEVVDGNFSWDVSSPDPTLKDMNISVSCGMRVAICGTVGSGKSSLLSCILGEVPKISGTIKLCGTKAYVPQSPWIQSGKIEENILFGEEMDRERYDQECLLGLLDSKTVIYVTHQVEFLPAADLILVMKDGRITQAGKYNDILNSGTNFRELVSAHKVAFSALDSLVAGSVSENSTTDEENGRMCGVLKSVQKEEAANGQNGKTDDIVGQKGQLVQEEEREKGRVGLLVYWKYITTAYGGALALLILLSHILFQLLQIGSNYWIAWATPVSKDVKPPVEGSTLIIVYVALAIGSSFFSLSRALFRMIDGYKTATILFNRMHLCIFRAPMLFFDSTPCGRILNRASTDQSAVDLNVPGAVWGVAFSMIQLLGVVAVLSQVAWQVFITFIPVIATCIWLQQYYIPSARELARLNGVCKAPVIQHFAETISGSTTIRSFDQESRFKELSLKLIDGHSRPNFYTAGIAGLAVTYGLSLNTFQTRVIRFLCNMENQIISVERILQYTAIPSEPPLVIEEKRPDGLWPAHGEVVIQDLQVRYAPHMPLVLRGLTCTFLGGMKTGIVGRTGSGKSTLIQTLFRIVEPAAGQIQIDGINISTIGLHDLRSRLSIIPQDPTMFEGTVRSNLDPLEEYTDEHIWEALDKCQLGDEVRKKEGKLDSAVTENGENWSMGQRQLVCLGRVLLKKSKVLVLDEATSSVDTATDNRIQQTLKQHFSDCTVLSIAHRITTVVDSDMVLLLDHGLIEEHDSPTKLLEKKSSSFSKLVAEYSSRSSSSSSREK
ncbi:hypothetical protein RHMOL_Rhmol06G0310300 [Rhododendron molle]|uniref:Uncharacterized protein n=1 Tax=Rhododendron molle TaxID=49168 RepID=A0ACC0NIY0_RHOML|nr:hypothetical protein RHMOL_Rhmol06G0310300 [Rhododendron molle]